jgi:hypothetical protein
MHRKAVLNSFHYVWTKFLVKEYRHLSKLTSCPAVLQYFIRVHLVQYNKPVQLLLKKQKTIISKKINDRFLRHSCRPLALVHVSTSFYSNLNRSR